MEQLGEQSRAVLAGLLNEAKTMPYTVATLLGVVVLSLFYVVPQVRGIDRLTTAVNGLAVNAHQVATEVKDLKLSVAAVTLKSQLTIVDDAIGAFEEEAQNYIRAGKPPSSGVSSELHRLRTERERIEQQLQALGYVGKDATYTP